TLDLGSLAKLTKWKEGIADFHPNMGKNVVQSLKENETLKSALHTWKKTKVPVGIRSADTGMGIKIPHIEHATVGEIAENFARVRAAAKEDAYQLAKGNGGSGVKGTGNREAEVPPAFRQTDFASSYEARYNQTPSPINSKVEFEGIRGESLSTLKPPSDPKLKRILDEAGIKGIQYKNGVPDFSPVSKAQIEIDYMLGGKGNYGTKARTYNFAQADQKLADKLNDSVELARQFGMEPGEITAKDIDKYRTKNQLTWHEVNDVKIMQLVPTEINKRFGHLGGVGEINAGAFEPGGFAKK
ncbi:HNH endonuclease, partial [Bacillus cytotoxicus]|uniref:HNH endonuclease n=1 Tax=Bacillus cytotoxicus TaxID=580165 RepID=UPI00244AC4B0